MPPRASLTSQSAVVSFFSLAGSALGLVVYVVFAARLGTSPAMDLFMAIIALPNAIGFLAQRLTTQVLVPGFHSQVSRYGREYTFRSTTLLLTWGVTTSVVLVLLIWVGSPWLTRWFLPTITEGTPASLRALLTVASIGMVADVARAFLAAVCLAEQRFALFYLPPLFKHAALIGGVWFLYPRYGLWALVLSWVIGSALALLFLAPAWHKYPLGQTAHHREPAAVELIGSLLPVGIAMGLVELRVPLERAFASQLATGSISLLSYADKLVVAAYSVLPMSVNVASLTSYSKAAAEQQPNAVLSEVRRSLHLIWLVSLPMACAMAILAAPTVQLLFERNRFLHGDTVQVALLIGAYQGAFLGYALAPVFGNALLCLRAPWRYARMEGSATLAFLVTATVLAPRLGAVGIALATSVAGIMRVTWGVCELRCKVLSARLLEGGLRFGKVLLATAAMSVLLLAISRAWPYTRITGVLPRLGYLVIASGLGLLIYVFMLRLLRLPLEHDRGAT